MVFEPVSNLKNPQKGTTLVEIAIVFFIIAIFFTIVIAGLPEIERRFALSRATHKLAQDLRSARDSALSGIKANVGGTEVEPKGYGVYVDLITGDSVAGPDTEYVIYADIDSDQIYDGDFNTYCKDEETVADCIVSKIDVSKEDRSLYIKRIDAEKIDGSGPAAPYTVGINFLPPDPAVNMESLGEEFSSVDIVLGLRTNGSLERIISVNKSGLINVQ